VERRWGPRSRHYYHPQDHDHYKEGRYAAHHKALTGWKFSAVTTHPGIVLVEEFLKPLNISQNKLVMDIHVPATRMGDIVHGRRAVTPDISLRLARYFGTALSSGSTCSRAMTVRIAPCCCQFLRTFLTPGCAVHETLGCWGTFCLYCSPVCHLVVKRFESGWIRTVGLSRHEGFQSQISF
jgi:addiction module HigA family antidote